MAVGLAACGSSAESPLPPPSASIALAAPSAPAAASAPASANSGGPGTDLHPKQLKRRASPNDLRQADEKGCANEQADACKRMADRFRGYGAPAGCGVDRGRGSPFIKRVSEDTEADERVYTKLVQRGCELGDANACALSRAAFASYALPTRQAERSAVRSDIQNVGINRYRLKVSPEWAPVLADERRDCMSKPEFACGGNEPLYFRREKDTGPDHKLDAPLPGVVTEICKATHDCDDLMMMLDKNGYGAAELASVRSSFAETLAGACLAGECTCGHAARYLSVDDPIGLDLAILGCDDGEAEGCYELGRRFEEGRGVDKNEKRALSLYHLACPDLRPREGLPGPRMGEYSRRACDRLADLAAGSVYPPKDWSRAMFYAEAACPRPGFEIDHGPCVRLGMFWATNPKSTGRNGEDARNAAYGDPGEPVLRKECTRPSVKEACEAFDKALAGVK